MCSEWGTPRTRAPHLLLILATGNYSVRLNRFTFESTVAPCRTYCSPFPETFLQKGYALYFAAYEGVLMQA